MRNIIREPGRRLPKSKQDVEEFGPGKKAFQVCKVCGAYYYQKSWHHDANKFLAKRGDKSYAKKYVLCPADQMIKNRQYEGKLIIKNIPAKIEDELIRVIKNSGQQAYSMDPMHRIINIKKEKGGLMVTTTENELANKIARKIKGIFHKVISKVSFAGAPSDVEVVTLEFLLS